MHIDRLEFLLAFLAVLTGAAIQGSIGFGLNLVLVPVLALIEPASLPGVGVLIGFPLWILVYAREHHATDRTGATWILAGHLPGAIVGGLVVTMVSVPTLTLLSGSAVLIAVIVSIIHNNVAVSTRSCLVGGFSSGFMNTCAGIGGPPLALLYQNKTGAEVRSTLAASFFFGGLISAATLAVSGGLQWHHLTLSLALAPATILGSSLSRVVLAKIDRGLLRPAVLAFGGIAGVAVITNAIV